MTFSDLHQDAESNFGQDAEPIVERDTTQASSEVEADASPELDQLMQRLAPVLQAAEAHLVANNFEGALKAADELEGLGHVAAFEVRARAQIGLGETAAALASLSEGLSRAPQTARLWELFGRVQTEVGQLEEADASFRNALRCPVAEGQSVAYHCALLRVRQGRLEEAQEMLSNLDALLHSEDIDDSQEPASHGVHPLSHQVRLTHLRLLAQMEQWEQVIERASRYLGEQSPESQAVWSASLLVERSKALWQGRSDRAGAESDLAAAQQLSNLESAHLGQVDPSDQANHNSQDEVAESLSHKGEVVG